MKIETPIIAMLLASVMFSSLILIFMTAADIGNYDVSTDLTVFTTQNGTQVDDALNQWENTKDRMDNITSDFESAELTDTGSVFAFLSLALRTGKLMIGSINIFKISVFSIAEIIGIPPVFIGVFVAILLITIVVSLIMLLIGRTNY